jgi:hypothetical protein
VTGVSDDRTADPHVPAQQGHRTLLGQETQYEAQAEFSPSSIRVFVPPLPAEELQAIIGDSPNITASAMPYYKLEDWGLYPRLLAAHVGLGMACLTTRSQTRIVPSLLPRHGVANDEDAGDRADAARTPRDQLAALDDKVGWRRHSDSGAFRWTV